MNQLREWFAIAKEKEAGKILFSLFFMCGMFFLGARLGAMQNQKNAYLDTGATGTWQSALPEVENWGLCFQDPGTGPRANVTADEIRKYNAYYIGNEKEKVLYLTFDCGYENGNTEPILDALQKHNAPATFFVVGHYLDTAPELVKCMVEEGHTVGNHTEHHPDMGKIATKEALQKELSSVEEKYKNITGKTMVKYFRPPQGKYSVENLKNAQELGYATFFWSLAYADWDQKKQPGHEEALKKLTDRVHPGAVVLLHSTSQTNGEILDELLSRWEKMGYRFGTLEELLQEHNESNKVASQS